MPDPKGKPDNSAVGEYVPEDAASGIKPTTSAEPDQVVEVGGPAGLDPVRYGDWERKGRCIDF
ncbi:MAG: DUF1674 domain-containing protein [Gammaproteobacteria bacterium]